MSEHEISSAAGTKVSQHIGWLKGYVECTTADNWQDMRLRCERQLEELSACVSSPAGTEDEGVMPWEDARTAAIDDNAYYVVQTNGAEWRDFDLAVIKGYMVRRRIEPDYVRGRPVWISKIVRPSSELPSTEGTRP